jgi:hypothetical protein
MPLPAWLRRSDVAPLQALSEEKSSSWVGPIRADMEGAGLGWGQFKPPEWGHAEPSQPPASIRTWPEKRAP